VPEPWFLGPWVLEKRTRKKKARDRLADGLADKDNGGNNRTAKGKKRKGKKRARPEETGRGDVYPVGGAVALTEAGPFDSPEARPRRRGTPNEENEAARLAWAPPHLWMELPGWRDSSGAMPPSGH
jgi:hypothetical protein